jgi:hypothetical protein
MMPWRLPDVVVLGPYTQGEIPEPFTYQFLDSEGVAIDMSGAAAKFYYGLADPDPTVELQDAEVTNGPEGRVRYVWAEDDLELPGTYKGDLWIGNGTLRLASLRLRWTVLPSVGTAPAI